MPSDRPLLITGMHRSGTSLLTSVLARAGLDLGDELLGPARGNPRGHFEDIHFLDLHEGLLRDAGQSMLLRRLEDIPSPGEKATREARELCSRRHGMWGFKDPRTSLFLEFWLRLLPDAGFVLIFRHPIDVLSSLLRRSTDPEILCDPGVAFDSWSVYNRCLLDFCRAHPERCLLVALGGAVADLRGFVETVAQRLDVPLDPRGAGAPYEPSELHRSPRGGRFTERLRDLAPEILSLYEELVEQADIPPPTEAATEPATEGHPPLPSTSPLFDLLRLYDPRALVRREEALLGRLLGQEGNEAPWPTAIGTLLEHHRKREEEIERLEEELERLRENRGSLRSSVETHEQKYAQLDEHCQNLEQQLSRRQEDLDQLTQHSTNLEKTLAEHRESLRALQEHAQNLEQRDAEQERQLADFTGHTANLETLLGRCRENLAMLGDHAHNLEEQLAHQQAVWEDLRAHAGNLETEIARRDQLLVDLTEHTANLQQNLEKRQRNLVDLTEHAANLQHDLDERQRNLADLNEHAANLQRDLEERQKNLEDFVRHSRNLEGIRSEQQAQIEALASRLGDLAPQTTEP
jgi:uncharacterized coiled-coil protein SlyX